MNFKISPTEYSSTLTIYKIILVIVVTVYYVFLTLDLKNVYNDIRKIEALNLDASRFIALTIASNMVDEVTKENIKEDIYSSLNMDSDYSLFILKDETTQLIADEIFFSWEIIEIELNNVFKNPDTIDELNYLNLLLACENYNKNSTILLFTAIDYSKDLNQEIRLLSYLILFVVFIYSMIISYQAMTYKSMINLLEFDTPTNYNFSTTSKKAKRRKKADVIDINEVKEHYFVSPATPTTPENTKSKNTSAKIEEITDIITENANNNTNKYNSYKMPFLLKIALGISVIGVIVQLMSSNN